MGFKKGNDLWKRREPMTVPSEVIRAHKRQLRTLPASQRREAIADVIGDEEIQTAILDIYNQALKADNPYVKFMFWKLFLEQVLGKPMKAVEIKETKVQATMDYSRYTQDELDQLEALTSKGLPQIAHEQN